MLPDGPNLLHLPAGRAARTTRPARRGTRPPTARSLAAGFAPGLRARSGTTTTPSTGTSRSALYREEFDPGYDGPFAGGHAVLPAGRRRAATPTTTTRAARRRSSDAVGRVVADRAHRQADADAARHARRAAADPHRLRRLHPDDRATRGRGSLHRYYVIEGGSHVDSRYDRYPDALRPILPCYRSAFTAFEAWIERGQAPPPSQTVARTAGGDVANACPLRAAAGAGGAGGRQRQAAAAPAGHAPARPRRAPHALPLPRHRARAAGARREGALPRADEADRPPRPRADRASAGAARRAAAPWPASRASAPPGRASASEVRSGPRPRLRPRPHDSRRAARSFGSMRQERGQTSAEYVGILLVVAAIVGALIASGIHRDIAAAARSAVCTISGESCEEGGREPSPGRIQRPRHRRRRRLRPRRAARGDQPARVRLRRRRRARRRGARRPAPTRRRPTPTATACSTATTRSRHRRRRRRRAQRRRGGRARHRRAQGRLRRRRPPRPHRVRGGHGSAPGVAPLTRENAFTPWERVGMSEDEWRDFEREVLEELEPRTGSMGFLVGSPYAGVYARRERRAEAASRSSRWASTRARSCARLGAGGRALSAGGAASEACSPKLPAATRARLIARGVLPRTGPLRRPPAPPSTPGTVVNELDALGRSTGAAATITRERCGPARGLLVGEVPGYGGRAAGHAKGHLIARLLGGSGDDARNLTTLYQNPANTPVMSGFERQIARAVRERADSPLPGDADLPRVGAGPARALRLQRAREPRLPAQRQRPQQARRHERPRRPPRPRPAARSTRRRAIRLGAPGVELPARLRRAGRAVRRGHVRRGIAILVPGHRQHAPSTSCGRSRSSARRCATWPTRASSRRTTPEQLLPWGIDEGGNVLWWLMRAIPRAGRRSPTRPAARVAVVPRRRRRAASRRCSPAASSPTSSSSTRARRRSGAMRSPRSHCWRSPRCSRLRERGRAVPAVQARRDYERALRGVVAQVREASDTPAALRAAAERLRGIRPPRSRATPPRSHRRLRGRGQGARDRTEVPDAVADRSSRPAAPTRCAAMTSGLRPPALAARAPIRAAPRRRGPRGSGRARARRRRAPAPRRGTARPAACRFALAP